MFYLKNKLQEKGGTALMLAICILAFLTIMSTCLAMAIPTAYKTDDATRKMEQASIYAKAGLNMAVDSIIANYKDSSSLVNYLESAVDANGKISGKVNSVTANTGLEDKCPDVDFFEPFEITFGRIGTKGSDDEIIKVISTVEYQGVSNSAIRYFYFTADNSPKIPNDAISTNGNIGSLNSTVDGSLRAVGDVTLSGGATYKSIYGNNLYFNNHSVNVEKVANGIEGQEGNIYAMGNITGAMPIMYVIDSGVADYDKVAGDLVAGGYIYINQSQGGGHPNKIAALGNETVAYNGKDYAICITASTSLFYIGDPSVGNNGYFQSANTIPTAIYSNGNCYLLLEQNLTVYGNIVINGDLDLGINNNNSITVYGNVYVAGKINGGSHTIVPASFKDSAGNVVYTGSVYSNSDAAVPIDFADLTKDVQLVSGTDIREMVETDITAQTATFPIWSTAADRYTNTAYTPYQKKIQDYLGAVDPTTGNFALYNDGIRSYFDASNPYYIGNIYGVIHVTENANIVGDFSKLANIYRLGTDYSFTQGSGSSIMDFSGYSNSSAMDGSWMHFALYLDASGLPDDQKTLDVVISGEWFLHESTDGLPYSRLYVNDKDGEKIIRLFIKSQSDSGTQSVFYAGLPQAYVPTSATGAVTALNMYNGIDVLKGAGVQFGSNDDNSGSTIPNLYIFTEGETTNASGKLAADTTSDKTVTIAVGGSGTLHAYILAPLAKVTLDATKTYRLLGKILAGDFEMRGGTNQANLIGYNEPDAVMQGLAIDGVFTGSGGGSSGGGGSFALS